MPSLWDWYRPNRDAHGSYWFYWTTEDEMNWKENYRLWMTFINEYKNRGGRVTLGSDSGYIYNLYGFGYIQEMELMREAGFHPLEVIRSATIMGAEGVGMDDQIGTRTRSVRLGNWLDVHPAGVYGWAGDTDDPVAIELSHSGDHKLRIQPRQTPHRIDQVWLSRSQLQIPNTTIPIK